MKNIFLLTFLFAALLTACNSTEDTSDGDTEGTSENAGSGTNNSGDVKAPGQSAESTTQDAAEADDSEYTGPRRYTIKSGIVKYALTGSHSGSELMYFDDYGMREAKFTKRTISMGGQTQSTNEAIIITPENMYSINLDKKTAIKSRSPFSSEFLEQSGAKNFSELGRKMLEQMGGKIVGTETIAGKECEVWEMKQAGAKSWMWKDIPLKIEAKPMNMTLLSTATSVEINVPVPADKFKVPGDVTIGDAPSMPSMPAVPRTTKPGIPATPMQPR